MKKKLYYHRNLYQVVFVRLLIAFLNFQVSFALYDTVNSATAGEWNAFWNHALWVMIYVLAMLPMNLLMAYVRGKYIQHALTEMKRDYLKAVFAKNISEFQKDNNALYVSAITNDFDLVERDYLEQITVIIDSIINFATAIIIITIINPYILLVGFGLAILNVVISAIASKPIQKHNAERSDLMRDYSGFVKEVLSAFHIIKSNDLEKKVSDTFSDKSRKVQQKKYVIDKIMSFIYAIQNMNAIFTLLGLMLFVAYLSIRGTVVFAAVVVLAQNIDNFIGPIFGFSEALPRLFSVKVLFARIDESLKNRMVYPETLAFDGLAETIELDSVSFAYEDNLVLDQVSMKFEKGKKYLIVGPSGGGKSTVLRLLRKYFDPTSGEILVDGKPLRDIKKVDYFHKIANIEQQVFLFEDTLEKNLTLYKNYSEAEIIDAISRAGLSDFVENHPDGLKRMILDNGKNISGGEKSRIAIARGLLNKAQIIFLDEAFASLDLEKARAIEKSVLDLENVTVVNVSHVVIPQNLHQYHQVITVRNHHATISAPAS